MEELLEKLQQIHGQVFRNFTYEYDKVQYNTDEKWVMPEETYQGGSPIKGDCEDFALACRKLCREAGIPTRLVFCIVGGEGHLVLEANGWILDNINRAVVSRDDLANQYTWKYVSGYEPDDDWHIIQS